MIPPIVPLIVPQPLDPISLVELNGLNLQHLSDAQRNDPVIVTAAFLENSQSFKYASYELKNNPVFVSTLLDIAITPDNDGSCVEFFEFASAEVRGNFELASRVVENRGYWLFCLSDALKDDDQIFTKSINQDPTAYEFGSQRLRDNLDVLMGCLERLADDEILAGPLCDKIPKTFFQNQDFWQRALNLCNDRADNFLSDAIFANAPDAALFDPNIQQFIQSTFPEYLHKLP